MRPAVTLTIRKRSSGYRLAALACDSLEHAWSIANVLVRSPEYSRCFIVAVHWDGSELFSVGLASAPPMPSAPAYAARPTPNALPHTAGPPIPAPTPWAPASDGYAVEVIESE